MSNTETVTGGDLHSLWKTTHYALPVVENVYIEATRIHNERLAGGDRATFGPVYPAWQALQEDLHQILFRSGNAVNVSRIALDTAIAEYAYVDGESAENLTDAGRQLEEYRTDENITDPGLVVKPEGELVEPSEDD